MKKVFLITAMCCSIDVYAQSNSNKFTISGTAGVSYDGYGLTTNPSSPSFYTARRPWNLVRFSFQPTMSFGNFKLPFNFSFSPMRNNFSAPPFGLGGLPGFPKQTFMQWVTNPMNNLGINPTYKWAELQLGTQYLKYSDLSTGDIGAFGYGFSLKPGKYRFKFFRGITQQAFQPFIGATPAFTGVYKRSITIAQIALENEGKYFAGFNLVKGKDDVNSIAAPLPTTAKAAENLIISFAAKFNTAKGWYGQTELASTISTRDITAAAPGTLVKDAKPFMNTNSSSYRDHALQAGFGKKGKNWDVGASMKFLGAGYNTMGYPFTQNDRLEYLLNTKFNMAKNKVNVVAGIGQRFGNWSSGSSRTAQVIANANIFTQISDQLSINTSYNNFGFTAPSSLGGIKNVGNDLGFSPTYTWSTNKMSNLLSVTYNWSKYTEVILFPATTTINNTHTALLLYAPSFFNKPNLSPDFSVMYFTNQSSLSGSLNILSVSTSIGISYPKKKLNLRGQLLYSRTTIRPFTAANNITATAGGDYKLTKHLKWSLTMVANYNKYGNELSSTLPLLGASYLESTLRTALLYNFGK